MKLTLFTEELRECLNAAGLSDCGENDSWNYWYQRVLKAHNDAVERQIATEQSDNARLRELLSVMAYCNQFRRDCDGCSMNGAAGIITERAGCDELLDRMRELGVDDG